MKLKVSNFQALAVSNLICTQSKEKSVLKHCPPIPIPFAYQSCRRVVDISGCFVSHALLHSKMLDNCFVQAELFFLIKQSTLSFVTLKVQFSKNLVEELRTNGCFVSHALLHGRCWTIALCNLQCACCTALFIKIQRNFNLIFCH